MIALLLAASASASASSASADPEAPDPVAVKLSVRFAQKVAADPDAMIPVLVDKLTKGTDDPAVRAKRIYDWIALVVGYDAASYEAGTGLDASPATTLQRGAAVCEGYAVLFDALAAEAGLESHTVRGYGRGTGYDPHREAAVDVSNHAWNVVKIGERWRLLDATWGAGKVEDGFVRAYNAGWLFTDPETFGATHFPADPAWQLVDSPLNADAFLARPLLRPPLDARAFEPTARRVDQAEDHAELRVTSAVPVHAWVTDAAGAKLKSAVFTDAHDGAYRVRLAFPSPGEYVVHVGVPGGASGWTEAAELGFVASTGSSRREPSSLKGWQPTYELIGPDALEPGEHPRIELVLPGVASARVVVGDTSTPMERDGNHFVADGYLGTGPVMVVVAPTGEDETAWPGILTLPE